jgi:replicative DNA helicase
MPKKIPALDPSEIRSALPSSSYFESIRARLTEVAQLRSDGVKTLGCPTGFGLIDEKCSGLQVGLHLLGAEAGAGKTTFASQLAYETARQGYPCLFITFEETPQRLILKRLCAIANVPFSEIERGARSPDSMYGVMDANRPEFDLVKNIDGTLYDEKSSLSIKDIQSQMESLLAVHNARTGLIVVDYLQVWAMRRVVGGEYRQAVDELIGQLRHLAIQTNCAVLAISPQNRDGAGEAKMSSLRESSHLEYSADSVMFLTQDKERIAPFGCKSITLTFRKNRFGENNIKTDLIFDGAMNSFTDSDNLSFAVERSQRDYGKAGKRHG